MISRGWSSKSTIRFPFLPSPHHIGDFISLKTLSINTYIFKIMNHSLARNLLAMSLLFVTLALARDCMVCQYDGRLYDASNAYNHAKGVCNTDVLWSLPKGCQYVAVNTHKRATRGVGQQTWCMMWCPKVKKCPPVWTDKNYDGAKTKTVSNTFIRQLNSVGCRGWDL